MLLKMNNSPHWYIDATFDITSTDYKQLITIFFHDLATNLRIPGVHILTNRKFFICYKVIFQNLKILFMDKNGCINLSLKSTTMDFENY